MREGMKRAPHLKLGTKMIFWRKIVIFHTKYPTNFLASLRSAQFFYVSSPNTLPTMLHARFSVIYNLTSPIHTHTQSRWLPYPSLGDVMYNYVSLSPGNVTFTSSQFGNGKKKYIERKKCSLYCKNQVEDEVHSFFNCALNLTLLRSEFISNCEKRNNILKIRIFD